MARGNQSRIRVPGLQLNPFDLPRGQDADCPRRVLGQESASGSTGIQALASGPSGCWEAYGPPVVNLG